MNTPKTIFLKASIFNGEKQLKIITMRLASNERNEGTRMIGSMVKIGISTTSGVDAFKRAKLSI